MKIEIGIPWHEDWADQTGQPYDAIIDGDRDQIIKINEEGKMFYSHLFMGEHGTTLEYLPVPEDAKIIWRDVVMVKVIRTDNEEYPYNCQVWRRTPEHDMVYCGEGKFCKCYGEALSYQNEKEKRW